FNSNFIQQLARYEKQNSYEVDESQLKLFIHHATKSSFWKERFIKFGVDIDSPRLLDEIHKLPLLKKEEVRANIDAIKLEVPGDKVIPIGTSGTSGSSLKFTQTVSMENKQWAIWWRYRKGLGITLDTWMAWFGGKTIVSVEDT